MDILFIDAFTPSRSFSFPIGINLLSTIINEGSNYTSEVISFSNLCVKNKLPLDILLENNYKTIVDYILDKEPKIVSFYTLENSYFISLIVAKRIKEIDNNIKIILAGPQASLCKRETLERIDFIDLIAIGEGEKNIISILDYFNNKKDIEDVRGICYKKLNQIICNEPQELNEDLDGLPMLKLDKETLPTVFPIETGRGCPYSCSFCCTKTFWSKVRLKSTDRLIAEIKYYMNKYDIKKFSFVHDLFTVNRRHILEFCRKLIDLNINIGWGGSARIDTLDEEMISLMARAGCNIIFLGIETGSQRMQKEINKNINLSEVKDIIRLLAKYNIEMKVAFIYGLPNETKDDLLQTLDLIRFCVEKMSIEKITLYKCVCCPGSEIYFTEKDHLVFDEKKLILYEYPGVKQVDFIKHHPGLFSSLFTINNELQKKYMNLDVFISYIYTTLYFSVPRTINEIILYYNSNILDFYTEYEQEIERIVTSLTKTLYSKSESCDIRQEMLLSLEYFIKCKIRDQFIIQLLEFEIEIVRTTQGKNKEKPKMLTFDYDMLLYCEKLKKKNEQCRLIFSSRESGEVEISRAKA